MAAIPGKHVLYLALQPSPEAAAQALELTERLRREHGLSGKPVATNRLHVSLNHLGVFKSPPTAVMQKAVDVLGGLEGRPFTVAFNRVASWGKGAVRPVVLWGEEGVIGVQTLYSDLNRELARHGMAPRREPPFEPHMTLLYDRGDLPETFVEPVSWRIEAFTLIHAVHGEGRVDVVERFPLQA
jgi:2'-5' RNA ligase